MAPSRSQQASGRAQVETRHPPYTWGYCPPYPSQLDKRQGLLLCDQLWCHRHPCPTLPAHPIPVSEVALTAFLHTCSHAYVGPHALAQLAQVSHTWALYCVDTLVCPAVQPPPPASDLPSLERRAQSKLEGGLPLFLVLKVSISAPPFLSFSHSVSGPLLPQSGVCTLPPKALRKSAFCCLSSQEGLEHSPRALPVPPFTVYKWLSRCLMCSSPQG